MQYRIYVFSVLEELLMNIRPADDDHDDARSVRDDRERREVEDFIDQILQDHTEAMKRLRDADAKDDGSGEQS